MNSQNIKIEGYDIQETELLGQGQFGRVYACKSRKQNEQNLNLCIKIMRVIDQKSAQREAEILNLIKDKYPNNPNIVKIYEVKFINLPNEQFMAIVMERCKTDLKKIVADKKVFSNEEVLDFLRQILVGYQPFHDQSFVHRDIKPENIMVIYEGGKTIYKLADFGTGKKMEKKANIMFQTAATGTPVYAPPEINQLGPEDQTLIQDSQNCKQINSIDIFSIGMIIYQLLYGGFPFELTLFGIQDFLANLKGKTSINTPNKPNVDKNLAQLIEKMVVYLPSQRITFQEVFKQYVENNNSRASTTTSSDGKVQFVVNNQFNIGQLKQNSDQPQIVAKQIVSGGQTFPQAQGSINFQNQFPQNPPIQFNFQQGQNRLNTKPENTENQKQNDQQFRSPAQPAQNQLRITQPNPFKNQFNQQPQVQFNQIGGNNGNANPVNQFQQQNPSPPVGQFLKSTNANLLAGGQQQNQPQFQANQNEIQAQQQFPRFITQRAPNGAQFPVQFNNNPQNPTQKGDQRRTVASPFVQLTQEIKDSFTYLIDNSDLLKPECAAEIEKSLQQLNNFNNFTLTAQNIINAVSNLKTIFRFKPEKKYSDHQIRLLFILTCFFKTQDYSNQINIMGVEKMKQLLNEWESQSKK